MLSTYELGLEERRRISPARASFNRRRASDCSLGMQVNCTLKIQHVFFFLSAGFQGQFGDHKSSSYSKNIVEKGWLSLPFIWFGWRRMCCGSIKKKAYLLLLSLSVLGAAGALHHGFLGEADSVRVLDDAGLLDGLWKFTRFSLFFLLSKISMKLTDFLVGVVFGVVALVLLLVVALGGLVLLIGFLRVVVLVGLAVVLVVLLLRDAFLFDFALNFSLFSFIKRSIALLPRHP